MTVFPKSYQPEDAPFKPVLRKRETKSATRVVQRPILVTRLLLLMYSAQGLRSISQTTYTHEHFQALRRSNPKVTAFMRILRSTKAGPSNWTGRYGSGVNSIIRYFELDLVTCIILGLINVIGGVLKDGKAFFLLVFTCYTPYPTCQTPQRRRIWTMDWD